MRVDKFQLFMYIQEQDKVLDCVENCLNWISYRPKSMLTGDLKEEFIALVDSVITPIEELTVMVKETRRYFENFSEGQRQIVKNIIRNLHDCEHDADKIEDALKFNIFSKRKDPIEVYHLIELAQRIGAIANHAENTGDMMRAIIERD